MSFQVVKNPVFIQGSTWAIENVIETPLDSVTNDPAFTYINVFSLIFRVVVQLEKLFVKKKGRNSRKLGEDQANIFHSLEKSLQMTGIDGKSCLLRAICEMQQNPVNHYSIMGEIITALLTPKRAPGNMMHDYLEAERVGQADVTSCSSVYLTCPVSLFNLLRTYSTPADKPASLANNQNQREPIDPGLVEDDDESSPLTDEGNNYSYHDDDAVNKRVEQEVIPTSTEPPTINLAIGKNSSEIVHQEKTNDNHLDH